jgi:acyl-CoA thioester hydrolase
MERTLDREAQTAPHQHRFQHVVAVRYADTDAQGHVYFANYLTFFDEAMTGYLHAIGCPPARLLELGCDVVFADAKVRYLGRSRFEDRVVIHASIVRVGRTSLVVSCGAWIGEEPVAAGELVSVCVDAEMRPVPVPEELRVAVARFEG